MRDIVIKKIKPMSNVIIVTCDKYKEDAMTVDGIILGTAGIKGSIKMYQKVIAVGPLVRDIKEGDMVMLNLSRYYAPEYTEEQSSLRSTVHMKNTPKFIVPHIMLDGQDCLQITSQDIEYIIEEAEYPEN